VPRSKIEIVPNGVDEYFSPAGEESDYILYAGTIDPRKGIADLIAVWESLPAPRPRLILCGDPGWGIRIPASKEIQVTGYVPRERLRGLYRNARAFVYPSLHEGFGLPPLEAMACGAPVIATRTGAVSDYAGDAAIVIPPGDRGALRDSLQRLLQDHGLRRELRARGPQQAARFRWDESARLMTALLAEALRCG
jgi:glycosyltransferase involved in cell wall biosynthesis